jgi:predicted dehydrogenase
LALTVDEFVQREISRRQFLGRSARHAAGVAAGVVSLAATAQAAPGERVRLGIVGVRNRGRELASLFARLPDVEIRSLCDVDASVLPGAVAAVVEQGRPAPQCERDPRRLFDDPSIDAVVIATPDHSHAPLMKAACLAGKDVYLESPATWRLEEGPELIAVARQTQRIVQCGIQERSSQSLKDAIQHIRSSRIGTVGLARAWTVHRRKPIPVKSDAAPPADIDYTAWLGAAPQRPFNPNRCHFNWRWFWDYGGGELTHWGSHWLDLARWGMDLEWPQRVSASGGNFGPHDATETPDTLSVQFDCGASTVLWEHRLCSSHGLEGRSAGVAFYGERGVLVLDRGGWKVYDGEPAHGSSSAADMQVAHLEAFVEAVRTRVTPPAELADAVISAGWCHLGNLAYRQQSEVRFDPKQAAILA